MSRQNIVLEIIKDLKNRRIELTRLHVEQGVRDKPENIGLIYGVAEAERLIEEKYLK